MVVEIEETGELVVVDEVLLRSTNDVDGLDVVDIDVVVLSDVLVLLGVLEEVLGVAIVLVVAVVLDVSAVLDVAVVLGVEDGLTSTVVKVEKRVEADEVGLLVMLAVVEDGVAEIVVDVVVDGVNGFVGNVVNVVGIVVLLVLS